MKNGFWETLKLDVVNAYKYLGIWAFFKKCINSCLLTLRFYNFKTIHPTDLKIGSCLVQCTPDLKVYSFARFIVFFC